jgi:hypothetical protein
MKFYKKFDFGDPPQLSENMVIDNRPVEAVGEAVVKFEDLDYQLSNAISFLLNRGAEIGSAITAELSFGQKLKVFSALLLVIAPECNREKLRELCRVCRKAEEMRNTVVHSSWRFDDNREWLVRRKVTARLNKGVSAQEERLHVWQIQEVGGYCGYAEVSLYNFMVESFPRETHDSGA